MQSVFSQVNLSQKALYKISKTTFDKEDYQTALQYLLQYDSLYPGEYEVRYRIGACYLNSEFEKKKAIPYMEQSIKTNKKNLPPITFRDLGHLYHLDYQLDKSIKMYQQYLSMKIEDKSEVEHLLESVKNAKKLMSDSLKFKIENVGPEVNTSGSEVTPHVSADESRMFYQEKESRSFYLAYYKKDHWGGKVKLDIPNLSNYKIVKFAGISPDGEQIFIQLGDSNNTDIYYGQNFLKTCNQLVLFNTNINSPYHENSVSMTPDGNTLYFSSDRPGGYGGYDIYVSKKDKKGEWGLAKNAGPIVNTKYDELYPSIHPSLTSLFFSSNGHETMGGFDIFEARLENDVWADVVNVGYPINTTYDDISYSVTAKGDAAYLSSTRNDKTQHFDIYKVSLKENIPLTLVKGRILAGTPPKPIGASIKVVDKLTHKPLKYIYSPNPQTGQYLLIFPPGKDYDMIIKAKGYNPYVINIYIPNQTYFYENFQEIILNPIQINSLGETIGEEIKIKNTFFDVYKTSNFGDSLSTLNAPKNYDKLLNIIENLIKKTDTLGLNAINEYSEYIDKNSSDVEEIDNNKDYDKLFALVEEAIESTDSVALKVLDENAIPNISFQNRYFYNIDKKQKPLDTIIVASDTIFAVKINHDASETKNADTSKQKKIAYQDVNTITGLSVYFDKDQNKISDKYTSSLAELAHITANNSNLYIKIIAYANPDEDAQIAIARAIETRSFLVGENLPIETTNTVAMVYDKSLQEEGQRVDVVIFESENALYEKNKFSSAVKLIHFSDSTNAKIKKPSQNNKNSLDKEQIVYKVQIASGADYLTKDDEFFKGKNVEVYRYKNLYKYVIGNFSTSGQAFREQLRLISEGFEGAFVVKFKNGVRVD